jgi:hypothetical protein
MLQRNPLLNAPHGATIYSMRNKAPSALTFGLRGRVSAFIAPDFHQRLSLTNYGLQNAPASPVFSGFHKAQTR